MKITLTVIVLILFSVVPVFPGTVPSKESYPSGTALLLFTGTKDFPVPEHRNIYPDRSYKTELNNTAPEQYPFIKDSSILLAAANPTPKTPKPAVKTAGKKDGVKTESPVSIKAKAVYLMPMGDWKDLIDPGYGGMLEICFNDLFFKGFRAGIETGYLYASGRNDDVKKEYIVPAFLTLGYKLPVAGVLGILPRAAAGEGYFNLSYKTSSDYAETKGRFEPVAKGGLFITCDLGKTITMEAGSEYGVIFEKDGRISFLLFQFGLGINF